MTLRDQVQAAYSNVGRRKLRSALASLGVVVGTVTIVIMVSLASGVREHINKQFAAIGLDRVTVNPSGGGGRGFGRFAVNQTKKIITPQDVARWKTLPGVVQLSAEVNLPNSIDLQMEWNGTNQPVRMAGEFRPGALFQEPPQPVAGTLDLAESGGIVLSQGAVRAAGLSSNDFPRALGQTVKLTMRTSRGESQDYNLKVQGISEERLPTVQISVADRVAMKNWWFNTNDIINRDGYDSVSIRATDVMRANDLSAQLRKEGFMVQSIEVIMTIANRVVTLITAVFTMIGGIALFVATIGIANTMVMAIYERTREIGILKAMGASRGEIRRMFMLEAAFIGMIGGVIGLILGWLLGVGLNQGIHFYLKMRDMADTGNLFVVTLPLAFGAIAFATLIGLVAGLLPAQRAASLDPLEALRHE